MQFYFYPIWGLLFEFRPVHNLEPLHKNFKKIIEQQLDFWGFLEFFEIAVDLNDTAELLTISE